MSLLLRNLNKKARQLKAKLAAVEVETSRRRAAETAPAVTWAPFPDRDGRRSPQRMAYESQADELFFGGSAGGGKTDLLLGLALTSHRHSILYRRLYSETVDMLRRARIIISDKGRVTGGSSLCARTNDDRVVDFGAVQHEDDKERFRGRPHDLCGFDELPLFTRTQYQFLIGWNRNAEYPQQRCRVVCTGNPPTRPEDRWVVEEWAPWLDGQFPDPAEPGELRWYTMLDGKMVWLKPDEPFRYINEKKEEQVITLQVVEFKAQPFRFVTEDGREEFITPRSRTFIPARVDDNPILMASGYKAVLQAKPEPLRSQLLYGDFNAGVSDDEWQVIPTEWVRLAQKRWKPDGRPRVIDTVRNDTTGILERLEVDHPLTCMGVDPARGGACATTISKRYGTWFAPIEKYPGKATPDGPHVLGLIQRSLAREGAMPARPTLHIDVIGVGASVFDLCRREGVEAVISDVNFGKAINKRDRSRTLKFSNLRAWAYWSLREALDPELGDNGKPSTLALPPDPELLADLCAARWGPTPRGVQIEAKEDIVERIGRSPDCGDAVVMAHLPPRVAWKLNGILDD